MRSSTEEVKRRQWNSKELGVSIATYCGVLLGVPGEPKVTHLNCNEGSCPRETQRPLDRYLNTLHMRGRHYTGKSASQHILPVLGSCLELKLRNDTLGYL